MGRMQGKVAAITGGAGGIGGAAVRRFLEEGAKVAFCDRDAQKGVAFERELGSDNAFFVETDVSNEADTAAFIGQAVARFGKLDVLVNNAGIRNYVDVTEASEASWDQILGVNLKGYAFCAKAAIHGQMRDRRRRRGREPRVGALTGRGREMRAIRHHQGRDPRPDAQHGARPCGRTMCG